MSPREYPPASTNPFLNGSATSSETGEEERGKTPDASQLHIDDLPNHLLIAIFRRLPLVELLPLELVSRRWRWCQEFLLCEQRALVLLSPAPIAPAAEPDTLDSHQLIQKAYQRYGVTVRSSFYHVTLGRKGRLTRKCAELFMRKLPNIAHLELVQIGLGQTVDLVLYLLDGWNLESLTLMHDEPVHFRALQSPSSAAGGGLRLPLTPRRFAPSPATYERKGRAQELALHRLLQRLSPDWQPSLRRLTLLTFDSWSGRPRAKGRTPLDLSQLDELHLIRPWDLNQLTAQLLADTFLFTTSWFAHLKKLTLYSDSHLTSTFVRERAIQPHFQLLLARLTDLTINFINHPMLDMIRDNCLELTALHLAGCTLSLVDLVQELEPLQFQLQQLRLTYPYQCLDKTSEWKQPIQDGRKCPLPSMIALRRLHLTGSSAIHAPELAAPILERLFPKLEQLLLDRNKVANPTGRPACTKCANMRQTAFSCKHRLIQSLGQFGSLRQLAIQLETPPAMSKGMIRRWEFIAGASSSLRRHWLSSPSHQSTCCPATLQEYEVYHYPSRTWSIETVPL